MKIFIANFGHQNYLWQDCLSRSSIASFEEEDMRPYWLAGDREGYVARCIAFKKTASGIAPTPPVASRWFNIAHVISDTEGDMWIHREKNEVWWTISRPGEVEVSLQAAFKPARAGEQVYVLHKQADPWSNKTRKGNRLEWSALHAKARTFLFTESTLQRLTDDNAAYALALINGDDLGGWHSLPAWKQKAETARKNTTTIFDARQRAVVWMAMTVQQTVAGANGQQISRTAKNKQMRFASPQELEAYIRALVNDQGGRCAITNLPLQFDGESDDDEMLCSLDRIDSAGHYETGKLQVVCRFVNRWKNDAADAEFRRLIRIVRGIDGID